MREFGAIFILALITYILCKFALVSSFSFLVNLSTTTLTTMNTARWNYWHSIDWKNTSFKSLRSVKDFRKDASDRYTL